MLASILLKGPSVHMPKLAIVSIMRAASPALYALLRYVWRATNTRHWMFPLLTALLSLTTIVLQFTSTILLSDVNTGYVTR
jgi:hypothetical protein